MRMIIEIHFYFLSPVIFFGFILKKVILKQSVRYLLLNFIPLRGFTISPEIFKSFRAFSFHTVNPRPLYCAPFERELIGEWPF